MLKFTVMIFAVVTLQTYLSRRDHKLLGLILPMVNLLYAIIAVVRLEDPNKSDALAAFVLTNVSTVMLVVVYFTIRKTMYVSKEKNIKKSDE